jgi:hypothetical protein
MLETSKDLLFIVIAFCVLWLTLFSSWAIYYMVMLLKQFNEIIINIRKITIQIEELVTNIRGSFKHTLTGLSAIVDGVAKISGLMEKSYGKKVRKKKTEKNSR